MELSIKSKAIALVVVLALCGMGLVIPPAGAAYAANASTQDSAQVTQQANPQKAGVWKKSSGKWWYQNADGSYPRSCWQQIDGKRYHFDSKGYMQTGWLKSGGKWYYLGSSGAMATGWKKVAKKWYYLNSSGAMQTGWEQVSGKWYYLDKSGAMKTGWQKVSKKWYYLNGSGVMQTGWKKLSGKWYYLNNSGVMQTGWQKVAGKYYYLNSSGVMQTKRWIGDYYVGSNGVMATNQWVGSYYVGADGKWIKGYGQSKGSVVYWTPGGSVYHSTDECPALSRSKTIKSGTVAQAKAAGKARACKDCY